MRWDSKMPRFTKIEVKALLDLIAGDKQLLTVKQFRIWRDLIMYAVKDMRSRYEKTRTRPGNPGSSARAYYAPCWQQIEKAQIDEQMVLALESLRTTIRFEERSAPVPDKQIQV